MRLTLLMVSLVGAAALAANPAYACKGGEELFKADMSEMPFGDDKDMEYKDNKVVVKVGKGKVFFPSYIMDDAVSGDVDLCVTFKLLKPTSLGGLQFWYGDNSKGVGERWIASFASTGASYVTHLEVGGGKWNWKDAAPSKAAPIKKGDANTIRVVVKGQEFTVFLNDKQVQVVKHSKTTMAPEEYKVGLFAQESDVEFSDFIGTSAE